MRAASVTGIAEVAVNTSGGAGPTPPTLAPSSAGTPNRAFANLAHRLERASRHESGLVALSALVDRTARVRFLSPCVVPGVF